MKRSRYWLPVAIWVTVIFTLSSIPLATFPEIGVLNIDKLGHLLEYLILGFLLTRAFSSGRRTSNLAKAVLLSIIVASLCAGIDELHQYLIPYRVPDIIDFSADVIGSAMGIFTYKKGVFSWL